MVITDVVFIRAKYVYAVSVDTHSWTQVTAQAVWKPGYSFSALAFNNKLWIFVKSDGNWVSDDGKNWVRTHSNGDMPSRIGTNRSPLLLLSVIKGPSEKMLSPFRKILVSVSLTAFYLTSSMAQTSSGPSKGSLILVGGDFHVGVERFVNLAGGSDANFVYIPTAASSIRLPSGFIYEPPESDNSASNTREFERELCKLFGVNRITVLHTRNRATANSTTFLEPLKSADGVWLSYGNAGRLADAYLDTLTQREIEKVLERGGVVGGTSAGAIIQGSYIVRGRSDKPLLMAKGRERGFGFLRNVAINPHLTQQKRENELVNVIDAYPKLLGIGLDEKAAIVVKRDQFEVIGEGRVAIYDNKKHGNSWYYWLGPGDRFELRSRKAKRISAVGTSNLSQLSKQN